MRYGFGLAAIAAFLLLNSFSRVGGNSSLYAAIEDSTQKAVNKSMGYKAFLGCSTSIDGGTVDKNVIVELLKNPLCVRDKNGQNYTVKEFLFTYAERGVYQDSTGLPTLVTDHTTVQVSGNLLNAGIQSSLQERLYKGDTLTFSEIIIDRNNHSMLINGQMKVVVK